MRGKRLSEIRLVLWVRVREEEPAYRCRTRRTKSDIETCFGIEVGTGSGSGSTTRIDIENRTMIVLKVDKKSANIEDEAIDSMSTRAKSETRVKKNRDLAVVDTYFT
ncbi:hypothetical protein EVAR_76371_1 [Eumeta japonica]|uniref:Uncharacterized protein n=1 Tax=Eumeta variegata TaxID=151549 RepID=A0A4C1T7P9_EUMVA|nr:hypothetical protein EVAR_76371_1 [Eumeta japonica]